MSLLSKDDTSLSLLVESIVKLISLNKVKDTAICTKNVLEVLTETFSKKVDKKSPSTV